MSLTPQITLTGTLQDIFGVADANASLLVTLCGYGQNLPRIAGTSLLAKTAPRKITATDGTFSFNLWGNDAITPAGTFYTVQLCDDQGNIVQTQAYQLTGSGSSDLSTLAPGVPPVPVPSSPTVTAGLVAVPFNAAAVFDCSLVSAGVIAFEMTLTGNVTAPTLVNVQAGQIVTFMLHQDATGGRTFAFPGNVLNATPPDTTPNASSTQSFQRNGAGNLVPIGIMTVS